MSPTRRSFVKVVLGISAVAILPDSVYARQTPGLENLKPRHLKAITVLTYWSGDEEQRSVFNSQLEITESGALTIASINEIDNPFVIAHPGEMITPGDMLRRIVDVACDPELIERNRVRHLEFLASDALRRKEPRCECPKCNGYGWLVGDAAVAQIAEEKPR